jgi:hypothetical protein
MEESRFFKFIWRFNGLVIMVAGVLAIGVLAFAGYKIVGDATRERSTHNIVNVQVDKTIEEKWKLGYMSHIQGSSYVMIALNSDQSYAQSYYSKSTSSARNYLFINGQNNERTWLFETNQYLVTDTDILSVKESGSNEQKVEAILYRVVKKDTNNDHRLTDDDLLSIGLSLPSGKGYKELLDGIEVFVGQNHIEKNKVLVVFQKGGVGYSANINLKEFAVSNITQLPKVGS